MFLWPTLHALGSRQWDLDCRRDCVVDGTDMVRLVRFLAPFDHHWTVSCGIIGNTWLSFGQAASFHVVLVSIFHGCISRLCPLIGVLGPASHGAFRGLVKHTSHYQSVLLAYI